MPAAAKLSGKALIQLTSVRPMGGGTGFAEWTGISRFAFDTPFQKTSGGAHAVTAAEQWKRTTILEVRHAFPYVVARQNVISQSVMEVSPIELAIESIVTRNAQLTSEINRSPAVLSSLQQVLAGSVSVSVNAGPMEFCNLFLMNWKEFNPDHVGALRAAFRDFLNKCRAALDANKKLIGKDQVAFHEQMEKDYGTLSGKLLPCLIATLDDADPLSSGASGGDERNQ